MFRLTKTSLVPLTRKYAQQHSSLESYRGDRDINATAGRARIQWLERLLAEGKFHTPKWAVARMNGTTYRVNGRHSSFMLANTNRRIPEGMFVSLDEFLCDSEQDLADLFDQFDNRHSVRTPIDKINAHKACDGTLRGLSATDVHNAVSGIAWFLSTVAEVEFIDEDRRIRLMHEYPEFVAWCSAFVKSRTLKRTGVVAAMFGTSERDRRAASEFWTLVKDESHPDPSNPTRILAKFLTESLGDRRNGRSRWTPRAFYVKTVHAWNAWRGERKTDLKYHPFASLPTIH